MSANVRRILRRAGIGFLIVPAMVIACAVGADAQVLKPQFVNATTSLSQGNVNHGGHGIAFGDIDNDGDLEVFVSNLTSLTANLLPDELFMNGGTLASLTDEALVRGISTKEGEAHSSVFADLDSDGDLDLFKCDTNGVNEVYVNDGKGYFTLSTLAGMKATINPGSNWGTRGVGCGDFDGDGDIDLFAGNAGQANELYMNRGDGTFTEEAILRGVGDESGNSAQTQGCAIADYDGDGDLDIFLAKRAGPNRLFRNNGSGYFTEVGATAGVTMATTDCDGGVWGDIDNDGDLDLLVAKTVGAAHGLFRNRGNGTFADETAINKIHNSYSYNIVLEDLDLDGDLDAVLFINSKYPHRTYYNNGKGGFTEQTGFGYETPGRDLRCAGFADLDNDGDRDLVVVCRNTYNLFYENKGLGSGGSNRHWLAVRVKGPKGQPSMPGAWVEIFPKGQGGMASKRLRVAHVGGTGEGYCRADDHVAWFGLPAGQYDVQARIPSGEVVRASGVNVDQTVVLDPTPPLPLVAAEAPMGKTLSVSIDRPGEQGAYYAIVAAFREDALVIHPNDPRRIPVALDDLFKMSAYMSGNAGIFSKFQGTLDAQGRGTGYVAIPVHAILKGLQVYFAYLTFDSTFPSGVRTVSRAVKVRIK